MHVLTLLCSDDEGGEVQEDSVEEVMFSFGGDEPDPESKRLEVSVINSNVSVTPPYVVWHVADLGV